MMAAAAYMYAPYTLFDTVTRGSSNEFAGMAFLPFALWGFTRLGHSGKRLDFILATLTYALFIIAHNVMTLYGSLLLVGYCLFLVLSAPKENQRRLLWHLGSAGVLAVMMTAFFWLPALLETDAVKINGVLENLAFIDVTATLRDLPSVFALPNTADSTRLQPTVPIAFHALALLLAIAGFFLPQPRNETAADTLSVISGLHVFLFATFGLVIVSQLTWSADVWQSVPLLRYSQFAWRPMSIGALVLALLAGIGTSYALHALTSRTLQLSILAGLLILLQLYAVPFLYRPMITLESNTLADAQAYEAESAQPALSSYGEYLPALTDGSALDIARPTDQARLQANPHVTVNNVTEQGTSWTGSLTVENDTTLVLEWLYLDGWRATLNGESLPVNAFGDAGFVSVDIPAGVHEMRVWYAGTSLQQTSIIMSGLALVAMLIVAITIRNTDPIPVAVHGASWSLLLTIALVGLGIFTFKALVIDTIESPLRTARLQDGLLRDVENPANPDASNFDNTLRLLGTASLTQDTFTTGDTLSLELFWTLTHAPTERDYRSIVQLVNPQGFVVAEQSNFTPGRLATRHWLTGYYTQETIALEIPAYTPPADYQLIVGVYDAETNTRLNVLNSAGNPTGVDVPLQTITITRSDVPVDTPPMILVNNDTLTLLLLDGIPESAQIGDEIRTDFLWRLNHVVGNQAPDVALVWQNDEQAVELGLPALVVGYPVDNWQAGDVWRGMHRLYVPPTLDAGAYDLSLAIDGTYFPLDMRMTVRVPERDFALPSPQIPTDINWENEVRLLGYDFADNQLTLYWQPQATIETNLRLFVQVLDADGQVLLVRDGIPEDIANGTRPTTSWLAEEIITTQHDLDALPAGDFTLLVGFYDPLTGERVRLGDSNKDAYGFVP
ncbi:MAG: hypothetical protein AAFN11_06170, partial [Chloroflexota bacterium]